MPELQLISLEQLLHQRRSSSVKRAALNPSDNLGRLDDSSITGYASFEALTKSSAEMTNFRPRQALKQMLRLPPRRDCSLLTLGSEVLRDKLRQLSTLTAQAHKLAEEQANNKKRANDLEEQIQKGELACGRMLQQALELQNAIEIKKRHLKEDKKKLTSELSSSETKIEEIRSIVSRINALTMETNAGISDGGSHQVRKQM